MEFVYSLASRLAIQYFTQRLKGKLSETTDLEIEDWFAQKDFFFILSIGRSGSMFLADLMNAADDNRVLHEPTRLDFLAYSQAFLGLDDQNYLAEYRKMFIYFHNREGIFSQYGEVNSLLRRHTDALRSNLPEVRIFHLVRDGRDVVRSMMARRTFSIRDPFSLVIHPHKGDPYYQEWPGMSRFERLCWYWWVENKQLHERIGKPILLEKLIGDYNYLRSSLLDPLGLKLSRDTWSAKINQPKNSTTRHAIPAWSRWDPARLEQFNSICGGLMEELGYYGS